jgi:hypothetical protein
MSFCIKFKYLGTFFVPELTKQGRYNMTITQRISQARNLFNSMNQQVLSNKKDHDRHPAQALSSDCYQHSTLGERKLGSERRKQEETGNVSPQFSPQDGVQVDDVGSSRETDHERTGEKSCWKSPTMESIMEVRRCR